MSERLPQLFSKPLVESSTGSFSSSLSSAPSSELFFVGKVGRVGAYSAVEASLISVNFPPSLLYPGIMGVSLNTW